MEASPRRHCPHCGMPVAQRAETCLMCGALLKEHQSREIRLPTADLILPLLLVVAVAAVWIWKPWQNRPAALAAVPLATPTATPSPLPTETRTVAPTATPLDTAVPTPTPTLPPNQTMHTVASGETISTIAKRYGTTTSAILKANNLKATSIIKPGATLVIPLPQALVPTETPTLPPTPTPLTYVFKSGDTLSDVARKFNTTSAALMAANGISDPKSMHVGQRIRIVRPDEVTATPTTPPNSTYTVKSGDTLSDISIKFKVSVSDIKKANGLKSDMLHIGQKLIIPGGPVPSTPAPAATSQPVAQAIAEPIPTVETTGGLTNSEAITQSITSTLVAMAPIPTGTPPASSEGMAADLLAPADGSVFEGPGAQIMLIWASVGILDDDEWYVVRLRRADAEANEIDMFWTKVTSFRVPAKLYVPNSTESQRWRWRVMVMRRTGEDEEGNWLGEEVRPASTTRVFYWK